MRGKQNTSVKDKRRGVQRKTRVHTFPGLQYTIFPSFSPANSIFLNYFKVTSKFDRIIIYKFKRVCSNKNWSFLECKWIFWRYQINFQTSLFQELSRLGNKQNSSTCCLLNFSRFSHTFPQRFFLKKLGLQKIPWLFQVFQVYGNFSRLTGKPEDSPSEFPNMWFLEKKMGLLMPVSVTG